MYILLAFVAPILIGWSCSVIAKKSKALNSRKAFSYAAWGFWLLLLWHLPIPIFPPLLGFLNLILALAPSAICFMLAANSMLKEMRAQQKSEFTDAAQ